MTYTVLEIIGLIAIIVFIAVVIAKIVFFFGVDYPTQQRNIDYKIECLIKDNKQFEKRITDLELNRK